MGKNSKIGWTDHTFNPWIGCEKVSEGCANCYAETMNARYKWAEWGANGTRKRTSVANWKNPVRWNKDVWRECVSCGWRRSIKDIDVRDGFFCCECGGQTKETRQRVFCASLGDVFEDRPELIEWRNDLLSLIDETPHLDWLILTKRPENVNWMLEEATHGNLSVDELFSHMPNIWIGTSVENQKQADLRLPELLRIPVKKRFVSMEPLLGEVDLSAYFIPHDFERIPENGDGFTYPFTGIDWVIVGGESGHGASPMNPKWVQSVRDQCNDAGVPFFFKQWGEYAPNCLCMTKASCKFVKRPGSARSIMFRCGKKKAGRMLDGREWNEML